MKALIVVCAVLGVLAVTSPLGAQAGARAGQSQDPALPALDHFKCYSGRFPQFKPRVVSLRDQFGRQRVTVLRPVLFCNPVSKGRGQIQDPTAHLTCYEIAPVAGRPAFRPRRVLVEDQFGREVVIAARPSRLCLPTQKEPLAAPADLDHFQCYGGRFPAFKPRTVRLRDQFDREKVTVVKPLLLCNPVSKSGGKIQDDTAHLKCYVIEPVGQAPFKPKQVILRDQFGRQTLTVLRPSVLCLPASKTPIEVDRFPNSLAQVTLVSPTGAEEVVQLSGPSTVYVFIGPRGEASDTDGDGLDQAETEMVQLSLTGNSSLGPLTVRLREGKRSTGEIEETRSTRAGRLDLPPFAPSGSALSFFDIFFEVEVGGNVLHPIKPKRMQTTILYKPPFPGDTYENPALTELYDENGNPTGYKMGPAHHVPVPPETDRFTNVEAVMTIQTERGEEQVELRGSATIRSWIGPQGEALDSDGDGKNQVQTEIVAMSLTGNSSLGPMALTLRDSTRHPNLQSAGEMEETTNITDHHLDFPINSFFDVFTELDVTGGQTWHNDDPLLLEGSVTKKPVNVDEDLESTNQVQLLDEMEQSSGVSITGLVLTLDPETRGSPALR